MALVNGNVVTAFSYTTEVKLNTTPAVGDRIPFNDIPILRQGQVKIQGIKCYDAVALTKSPNNNTVVAAIAVSGLTLTFQVDANEEQVKEVPVYDCIPYYNGGIIRAFNNLQINLTKSYLVVEDTTNLTGGTSLVVEFVYEPLSNPKIK
jgi:hypothetical protein